MRLRVLLAWATILLASFPSARAAVHEADVVVYGGTSAGIVAAVRAVRMGHSVVLVSPERRLGGMTTNGLSMTDTGKKEVIGGIAREFYRRLKKHYDDPAAWTIERREDYPEYDANEDAMWRFEPHVAEAEFEAMLKEAGITVVREERLMRDEGGVTMDGPRIVSFRGEPSGDEYHGRMFIDATYEGDLMAAAGVSYVVGREGNSVYGEHWNGVAPSLNVHNHRFIVAVDPYVRPGDPASGLLPGVHGNDPGKPGDGDRRVQAYCFRMCMSNSPANRTPFAKPAGYDEKRYELLLRNFEAGDDRFPMNPIMMPNRKTDTNNDCAVSTDNINMNYDYPEASYERRAEIEAEHLLYQQGLMWTLANDPRVPEKIRQEMASWGLASDEFTDNGHWPTEMYVREARRMVGEYVMTDRDARLVDVAEDSVGMGSYNMDSHNCQRYVNVYGHAANEGDVQKPPKGPYRISYRSLVPKRDEAENLLVPVCLSSSHIAYGTIRMEPVFMILGQSAATAACQAIDGDLAVQDVPYAALRERLLADGQVLAYQQPR